MRYHLILMLLFYFCLSSLQEVSGQFKNPRNIAYQWKTDTTKKTVPLSEFTVAVPKGAFQVLSNPTFLSASEGQAYYFKFEPVIAVNINGQAKAYPLNVLTIHEIANDTLAGVPLLVTFCPLCNSSMVYDRRIAQENTPYLLSFGVSGMLRNSDMVMYDNQTETWWQQLTGEALVGQFAGAQLKVIPSLVVSVEEFFSGIPKGRFCLTETCQQE